MTTVASAATLASARSFADIPRVAAVPVLGTLPLYKLGYYSLPYYDEVLLCGFVLFCKHVQTLLRMHRKYGDIVVENRGMRGDVVHMFMWMMALLAYNLS